MLFYITSRCGTSCSRDKSMSESEDTVYMCVMQIAGAVPWRVLDGPRRSRQATRDNSVCDRIYNLMIACMCIYREGENGFLFY